jgi:hypothetical protein
MHLCQQRNEAGYWCPTFVFVEDCAWLHISRPLFVHVFNWHKSPPPKKIGVPTFQIFQCTGKKFYRISARTVLSVRSAY